MVSIIVEADADCRSLGKKAIRKRGVVIRGVDWGGARIYCSNGCPPFIPDKPREGCRGRDP